MLSCAMQYVELFPRHLQNFLFSLLCGSERYYASSEKVQNRRIKTHEKKKEVETSDKCIADARSVVSGKK